MYLDHYHHGPYPLGLRDAGSRSRTHHLACAFVSFVCACRSPHLLESEVSGRTTLRQGLPPWRRTRWARKPAVDIASSRSKMAICRRASASAPRRSARSYYSPNLTRRRLDITPARDEVRILPRQKYRRRSFSMIRPIVRDAMLKIITYVLSRTVVG